MIPSDKTCRQSQGVTKSGNTNMAANSPADLDISPTNTPKHSMIRHHLVNIKPNSYMKCSFLRRPYIGKYCSTPTGHHHCCNAPLLMGTVQARASTHAGPACSSKWPLHAGSTAHIHHLLWSSGIYSVPLIHLKREYDNCIWPRQRHINWTWRQRRLAGPTPRSNMCQIQ
jgi:hypothetical protein